jgi:DNA-binding PadR family transcriptional regulator
MIAEIPHARREPVRVAEDTLHPALRRFEEAGAVTRTAQHQEGRPPRHVYELAGDDTEFLTRVGMFDELTPDERRHILAARAEALRNRIGHLAQLTEKAARSPQHQRWGGVVVAELAERAGRELDWIARLDEQAG